MEPIVQVQQVSFEYTHRENQPDLLALDGVSLEIQTGSFVAVLGHNGSGKSTLAKHINAILLPTQGKVLVGGMDTADESKLFDIRETAGMVFQNPDNQIVATVVEEDVAFAPENLGLPSEEIRRRVDYALQAVGMEEFKRNAPHLLSGGQKQRVAIAGVLAMNPQILVLDEASAMLDPRGRAGLLRVCQELHERGMTIVMITHFMEEAALADRVVVLDGGRVRLDGTPEEVLTQGELLESLNLDMPFACRLSLQLQRRGVPVKACVTDAELEEELCRLFSTR